MSNAPAKKPLPIPRPRVRKASSTRPVERAAKSSSMPPAGKSFARRYVLQRMLGRGSMGSVWLAEDERLQRLVALKILGSMWAESDDARRRFEREAKAVAKLHSPHIVQVYDYGIEDDRPFIVMELLDGEDLRARLKREERLSLQQTGSIVMQTCRALHVAHKAHIVHRDLKPGNVMIDRSTGDDMVKVLDFGVAKARTDNDTEGTKAGTLLGTPQYMAPEQARALPDVDHRADLWSVGIIAYRALTGRAPFRAKSVTDILVDICTVTPPRVTSLRPDLPPLTDVFFARALSRDRGQRFQTARELASCFYRLMDSSAPSMSLSVFDTGQFPVLSSDVVSASYPLADSQPSQASHLSYPGDDDGSLSQTGVTVSSSSPGASHADSLPSSLGAAPVSDTLSSLTEQSGSGVVAAGGHQERASGSFGGQAARGEGVRAPKRRGWLVGVAVAVGVGLLATALIALRGPSQEAGAAAEPTSTPSAAPSRPPAEQTAATVSAPAASPEADAQASAVAPEESAAPSASAAAVAASAKTPARGHGRAAVRRPPRKPPPPPKRDNSDLLLERF